MLDAGTLHSPLLRDPPKWLLLHELSTFTSVANLCQELFFSHERDHFFFRNLKMVISCFAQNKSKIAKYFFFSPNLSIIAHQNRHIGFQIGEYMHNILLSIRQSSNFFVLFSSPDDLAFDEGKWPLLNCTFIYFTKKAKTEKEIINNGVTCGR